MDPVERLSKAPEHDKKPHVEDIVGLRAVTASNASNLKTLSSGEHL